MANKLRFFIFIASALPVISLYCFRPVSTALGDESAGKGDDRVPWTLVIYMSSQAPNLIHDAQKYRDILRYATEAKDLHLTVLFDTPEPEEPVYLAQVHRGKLLYEKQIDEELNLGDPAELERLLLSEGSSPEERVLYPAERYALIIAGDAGEEKSGTTGWMPVPGLFEYDQIEPQEELESSGSEITFQELEVFTPHPSLSLRERVIEKLRSKPISVGYDFGSSGDSLTAPEIADVLRSVGEKLPGGKWDLLAFDACFMASFEILYELKDVVDFVVASETVLHPTSFPYSLFTSLPESPRDFAVQLVRESFHVENIVRTQLIAVDQSYVGEIGTLLGKLAQELSSFAKEIDFDSGRLLYLRQRSPLYLGRRLFPAINVDLEKWLEGLHLLLNKVEKGEIAAKLIGRVEEIQGLIRKALFARGPEFLKSLAQAMFDRGGEVSSSQIQHLLTQLHIDLRGRKDLSLDQLTSDFRGVVWSGDEIPGRYDLYLDVYYMLLSLQALIADLKDPVHSQKAASFMSDGMTLFYPDLISENGLSQRLEAFRLKQAPFYSKLAFSRESDWLPFLKRIPRWSAWLNRGSTWEEEDDEYEKRKIAFDEGMSVY